MLLAVDGEQYNSDIAVAGLIQARMQARKQAGQASVPIIL
jgi:hypothetical protein